MAKPQPNQELLGTPLPLTNLGVVEENLPWALAPQPLHARLREAYLACFMTNAMATLNTLDGKPAEAIRRDCQPKWDHK